MQLSSSSESLLDSEESDEEENCTARGRRQTREHRKHRRGRRRRIGRRRHRRRKHRKDWRKQVQEEKVGWVEGGWVGGAGALERSRREGKFEEEQKKERAFVLAKDLVLHGGSLLGGVATMYYLQRRGSSTE